jgi:hypothetical protein
MLLNGYLDEEKMIVAGRRIRYAKFFLFREGKFLGKTVKFLLENAGPIIGLQRSWMGATFQFVSSLAGSEGPTCCYQKAVPLLAAGYRLDVVAQDVNADRVGTWSAVFKVP